MSESKGALTGFKEFLMRGNVVELAVAVVIGTAFSKIVDAIVNGLVNPLVGAIGTKNLDQYRSCLRGPCESNPETGEATSGVLIHWGPVLGATLTFLITAAVVYFLMVLPMNRYHERRSAKDPVEETPPEPTEVELLREIRDTLVAQRDGSRSGAVLAAQRTGDGDTGTGTGGTGTDGGGVSTEK